MRAPPRGSTWPNPRRQGVPGGRIDPDAVPHRRRPAAVRAVQERAAAGALQPRGHRADHTGPMRHRQAEVDGRSGPLVSPDRVAPRNGRAGFGLPAVRGADRAGGHAEYAVPGDCDKGRLEVRVLREPVLAAVQPERGSLRGDEPGTGGPLQTGAPEDDCAAGQWLADTGDPFAISEN